jgi:hypothetical protein
MPAGQDGNGEKVHWDITQQKGLKESLLYPNCFQSNWFLERKKEFYLSSSRDIHLKNSYMSEQSYLEHCRVDVYCDLSIE